MFQTYPQLLEKAACMLAGFNSSGLKAGDKIVLTLSHNEEFIPAFRGCLLGGIIPVPLASPQSLHTPNPALEKLESVWSTLGEPFVLVPENLLDREYEKKQAGSIPENKFLELSAVRKDQPTTSFHDAQLTDTAFIQFSSGSTGQPKGVVLSHQNLLSNVRAIETGLGLRKKDIGFSWMPLFHDMGMVGYHLTPLHFGINHFLINTMDFVRKPLLWLDSLETHGATITAAPNFGQALVLKRLKDDSKKRWNLSKVRLVLNGAEPICVDLMQRFIKKMSGFGLESKAMFPVYGLAEATLAVSFPSLKEEPFIERLDRHELHKHHRAISAKPNDPSAISFVSEGFPAQGCEVRIVDDKDHLILDETIGHIQVKGYHVMAGYYNDPAATEEVFCDGWLRTGDLGFILKGRLCITGRTKDIIFVNGQNYYAHDLENIAQKVQKVEPGQVVFFGQRDSDAESDRLLLFLAGKKPASLLTLFLRVNQQLQQVLGLTVDMMIPITKRIPKTSSGKIQRYKLLEQYEKGEFDEAINQLSLLLKAKEARSIQHKVSPQTFTEKLLHKLWYEELLLRPEKIGIHDHFAELGGKSINAASILAELENYHIYLDSQILEKYKTISGIAGYIDKHPTRVRPTEEGKRKKVFGG